MALKNAGFLEPASATAHNNCCPKEVTTGEKPIS
jgi:hypothetical protein